MTVLPPALVVMLVRALATPTLPLKVVTAEDFALRLKAPLSVPPKVMLPAPASRMTSAPSSTASL